MLSQSEVDALLNVAKENAIGAPSNQGNPVAGVSHGDGVVDAQGTVIPFDFCAAERFTKEQLRAVEMVHEEMADRLGTALGGMLRSSVRLHLVSSDQKSFTEIMDIFPPNCLVHMIAMAPLPGRALLVNSPHLSARILEQRLGGRVEGQKRERALTEIDQSLLRDVVAHSLNDIKAAWEKVASVTPEIEESTTNLNRVQTLMRNERVVLMTFELAVLGETGMMYIVIPFSMLKPIASELDWRAWVSGSKEHQVDSSFRQAALENLSGVELLAQILLGTTHLTLRELSDMDVDDLIVLDTGLQQPLIMQIADQKLFYTRAGRIGNRLAVAIVGKIPAETQDALQ